MTFVLFAWLEILFEKKTLYLSLKSWYLLSKELNSSWWNYFYNFIGGNFVGVLFYQDFSGVVNYLYEFKSVRYGTTELISSALIVGYNNIHPPFFYLFLWAMLITWYEDRFIRVKPLLILGLIIFYWGSLWGVGNSAWGYFWVKDPIELMLLTAIVILLLYIHVPAVYKAFYALCILLFLISGILLLLRWGFLFTRHSFFNLLSTINFFKFYFILVLSMSVGSVFPFIVVISVLSFLLVIYYFFYLFVVFARSKTILKSFLLSHFSLLIFLLSWLKHQPHNFNIYSVFQQCSSIFYGFTAHALAGGSSILNICDYSIKRLIAFWPVWTYTVKVLSLNLLVYINWSRFFCIIFLLISIKKIYR